MGAVKTVNQFSIPFTGLKPGKHEFHYEIDDSFFDQFEYSLVKKGLVSLALVFDKQHEMMFILHFHFHGTAQLTCERCLDEYNYMLESEEQLIVRTGEEEFDDPEIMTIPRHVHEIDISKLIYEYINLSLPLIHQHLLDENAEPTCNNETALVLKKLQEGERSGPVHTLYTVEGLQADSTRGEEQNETDPRWEVLKKIRNRTL